MVTSIRVVERLILSITERLCLLLIGRANSTLKVSVFSRPSLSIIMMSTQLRLLQDSNNIVLFFRVKSLPATVRERGREREVREREKDREKRERDRAREINGVVSSKKALDSYWLCHLQLRRRQKNWVAQDTLPPYWHRSSESQHPLPHHSLWFHQNQPQPLKNVGDGICVHNVK